jgi:hypothetical protein
MTFGCPVGSVQQYRLLLLNLPQASVYGRDSLMGTVPFNVAPGFLHF